MRLHRKRKATANVPLFPGYIFVQPSNDQFESIRHVRGSCGLVFIGAKPAAVPETQVRAVQRLVESGGASLEVHQRLMPGLRVEVITGPFVGITGELVQVKRRDRLVINTQVLFSSVSIEVGAESISVLRRVPDDSTVSTVS